MILAREVSLRRGMVFALRGKARKRGWRRNDSGVQGCRVLSLAVDGRISIGSSRTIRLRVDKSVKVCVPDILGYLARGRRSRCQGNEAANARGCRYGDGARPTGSW